MKKAYFRLCLAGFLMSASSAPAIPAVSGNLILGFKAAGGQGADTCLEVNLGPASSFYGAAAGSVTVLNQLAVADLVDTYGADWNTRSDLFWGVAGTTGVAAVNGVPARTIWASRAETTIGTSSTPWPRGTTFALQVPSNTISTLYTGAPGSMDRWTATANSSSSVKIPASETGSWTAQEGFTPGVSFRYFNPSVMNAINTFPAQGSAYDGTAYTVLDLFEVRPGTAGAASALIGGIGLNSAGKLVFSTDITKFAPGSSGPVVLGEPTIAAAGAGYVVGLTGAPAGNYILQRSTTMTPDSWTTVGAVQSPAAGVLSFTDSTPPPVRGFYRIAQAP
jgi:hypothetical protein